MIRLLRNPAAYLASGPIRLQVRLMPDADRHQCSRAFGSGRALGQVTVASRPVSGATCFRAPSGHANTVHRRPAKQAALEAGAMGASISGAGPSVFAWFESRGEAEAAAPAVQAAFAAAGFDSQAWVSPINATGAELLPSN